MNCPKCNAPIKRFDLSPECKNCGALIYYCVQELELPRDAKKAELEFASARSLTARIKAAYVGSNYAIARLVLLVLSIAVLLMPLGNVAVQLGTISLEMSYGGIGLYQLYGNGLLMQLLNLFNAGAAQNLVLWSLLVLGAYAVLVLATAALFVTYLLAFINSDRDSRAQIVLGAINAVMSVAVFGLGFGLKNAAAGYSFASASVHAGFLVPLAVNIAMIVINVLFMKKAPKPVISENDEKRIAVYKQVKAGEVNLDDLPLPIFESEEERQTRLNALAGKEKKKKDKKKGGDGNG